MNRNKYAPVQPVEISKEEVAFWKAEIRASLKRQREEFITRIGYETLIKYFEALQMAEGMSMNEMAIVDEFSPAILSIITSTYNQDPAVSVKPLHPDADQMVQPPLLYLIQNPDFRPFRLTDLCNASMKYGMKKVGMKDEMQLGDFDLMVAGFTCVEMNHMSEPSENSVNTDMAVSEEGQIDNPIVSKIGDALKSGFDSIKRVLTKEEVEEKVSDEIPDEQRVDFSDATYCKRWNPLEILFDSRAVVWKESRFVSKIVKLSIADFNKKYPKFKGRITASSAMAEDITYQGHNNPDNKKVVTLYELEIKKKTGRNCVLVLSNGIDDAIDYYEKSFITNDFSMKYKALDNYGKIYPMSRARKAKKPQDDINHYVTIEFEHVDRAMRKIAVYMAGLSPAGQSAQISSDIYAIVEKITPQNVYEPMPAPSVVPENKEIVILLKDSINKAIGSSELAKSGQSDNEFATQDVLQNQAFQVNTSAVQDALKGLADELLDTLKDIQMQLWDGEDYFQVTGIKGGDQWYKPEMGPLADILVGDYLVESDITSAQKPNPMRDRQDALEYSKFITDPMTVQFAAMHNKRPTMEPINNVVKQFGQNPDMAFEDIQPEDLMPGAPGMPGQPPMPGNVIPVPGNQAEELAANPPIPPQVSNASL